MDVHSVVLCFSEIARYMHAIVQVHGPDEGDTRVAAKVGCPPGWRGRPGRIPRGSQKSLQGMGEAASSTASAAGWSILF